MGQTHAANIFRSSDCELAAVVTNKVKEQIKPVAGNITVGAFDWSLLDKVPFFTTLQDAFDNVPCDAVIIATPTVLHRSNALDCFNAGKHVFLEKPVSVNKAEGEEMIAAARSNGAVFHIGHCLRFFPEYSFLKKITLEKRYGRLEYLKLIRRTGVPVWGAWKDKDTSPGSITGPVFDLNIHDVDFALHIAGKAENITARRESYSEKLFTAAWQSASGTVIELDGGFSSHPAFPFRAGYTAFFEQAVLEFDSRSAEPLRLACGEHSEVLELPEQDAYMLELQAFAGALNNRCGEYCTPEEALAALGVCAEIAGKL